MKVKCSGCGSYYRKWDLYDGECYGCRTGWDDDAG